MQEAFQRCWNFHRHEKITETFLRSACTKRMTVNANSAFMLPSHHTLLLQCSHPPPFRDGGRASSVLAQHFSPHFIHSGFRVHFLTDGEYQL